MSTSGSSDLGPVSGNKATSDQGVTQTAYQPTTGAAEPPEAPRLVRITSPLPGGSISEPPNESSTLGLDAPIREKAHWPTMNHLRLVVIIGLMVLISVSMITGSAYTNELITLLAIIVTYFFAKEMMAAKQ